MGRVGVCVLVRGEVGRVGIGGDGPVTGSGRHGDSIYGDGRLTVAVIVARSFE